MTWSTACLDWQAKILAGQPPIPDGLPCFKDEADRALRVFKRLRLPDVPGTPRLEEAGDWWFYAIVAALFGSYDPAQSKRLIQEVFLLVPKKNGKALALDTPIATPSGFATMGDVRVGDQVIDADGKPTRVLDKSPVFIGHECYEVEFSTGEIVRCDAGHLWITDAHRDRDHQPKAQRRTPRPSAKTTEEIARSLKVSSGQYQINNHRTSLCGSLDLPEADLPIPPYALGLWLGDGTTGASAVTAGLDEADFLVGVLQANGQPAFVRIRYPEKGSTTIALGIPGRGRPKVSYRFTTEAAKLGVLNNKHIPARYLRGSRDQRLALLRGLMDSDGSITKAGAACFETTLYALSEGMRELINSLGFKATLTEDRAKLYGRDCGPRYRIQFRPFDSTAVFTIPRKLERQKPRCAINAPRSSTRQIVDVRRISSVPVQCITVESTSRQYLITRSLIPTHNTSYSAAIIVTAAILNRRPSAEFQLVAPTKEVADIAFNRASGMIKLDHELDKLFHIQRHIRTITHRRTEAVVKVKASDTEVITGTLASTLVDEVHVFAAHSRAAEVYVELRGALAARPEGFVFQISTQSKAPPAGVFRTELMRARAVRDGRLALPSLLPIIYELPPEWQNEEDRWASESAFRLVNPNFGRSVSSDFLNRELLSARESGPDQLALFASQHLNVEIGLALQSNRWAGADHWQNATDSSLSLIALLARSDVVCIGIDGGGLDDLLGLTVLGREKDGDRWLSWSRAWAHQSVLDRRKSEASRLRDFAAADELVVVDRLGDDIEELAGICNHVAQTGLLFKVGLDPMGIGVVVDALAEHDITEERGLIVGISQGWKLSGAIKTAERKLAEGALLHADQAMMRWCVGNAKVEPRGNAITITKQAAGTAKIDPLMALFDAVACMSLNPPSRRSIYENRGLLVV